MVFRSYDLARSEVIVFRSYDLARSEVMGANCEPQTKYGPRLACSRTLSLPLQLKKALTHYKKAVALEPNVYRYQNRLAFNLVQSRKYKEGFEAFFACYKIRPYESDMINNMGNIFMAEGQVRLARVGCALRLPP